MKFPRYSIVIPTYRRHSQLRQCLASISRLDYPRDSFEVVVVIDGEDANAESIAQEYATLIPIRALMPDHGGPARARNTGAERARGQFLLFLDDDCFPAKDWLLQWDVHTTRYPDFAAGGCTINSLNHNIYSRASQTLLDFMHYCFAPGKPGPLFLASNNFCVPAERFRTINGFSANFPLAAAEDRDFCDRWSGHDWPARRANAIAFHAHELTLVPFIRQHWNYGRGALLLHQVRKVRQQLSRIEPIRFFLGIIEFLWTREHAWPALQISVLLCISQLATVAGYFGEAVASGVREARKSRLLSRFTT